MNKSTEITVQYHLPTNWEQEKEFSFVHLSDVVTLLHESAYSATLKSHKSSISPMTSEKLKAKVRRYRTNC